MTRAAYGHQGVLATAISAMMQLSFTGITTAFVESVRIKPNPEDPRNRVVVFGHDPGETIEVILHNPTKSWQVRQIVFKGFRKNGSEARLEVHTHGSAMRFAPEGEDPSQTRWYGAGFRYPKLVDFVYHGTSPS